MQVKKLIALLLALALLLAGCGKSAEANKTRIGVFFADYKQSTQQEALLDGLSCAGFRGIPLDANGDEELQKTQLGGLLGQEYPLVIVEPAGDAAEIALLAQQAQIPCVFIGPEPEQQVLESWDKLSYVGTDDTQQGSLQGKIVLNCPYGGDINQDGVLSYAIIRGPEDDPHAEFITDNCYTALKESELVPNLLETRTGDWSRESGRQLCQELLAKYGRDIEAILCNSDELAVGAAQAVVAGGWTAGQDIYVVGTGGQQEALRLIDQEKITGTVAPDMEAMALLIAQAANALLKGTPVEKRYYSDYLTITRENISVYYGEE